MLQEAEDDYSFDHGMLASGAFGNGGSTRDGQLDRLLSAPAVLGHMI